MTAAQRAPSNRYLDGPSPSSLADVIDTILDKGLVIEIYLRVSMAGIELLDPPGCDPPSGEEPLP